MREENELLVWKSLQRNESVPQTKLHYERDMLFIESDDEAKEDDESGGSVEWEEDHVWDSDDQERMQVGVNFGADGWYNPAHHASAEERMREKAEQKRKAEMGGGKARVKTEEMASPRRGSPRSSGKKSGRTPVKKRPSGGKKPYGSSNSGSLG
jgi:hypothetical protein